VKVQQSACDGGGESDIDAEITLFLLTQISRRKDAEHSNTITVIEEWQYTYAF
jgi:hypothetical protein